MSLGKGECDVATKEENVPSMLEDEHELEERLGFRGRPPQGQLPKPQPPIAESLTQMLPVDVGC